MNIFPWIYDKKKVFSEIIASKMIGQEVVLNKFIQEKSSVPQNKYSVKLTTWNDLMIASATLNSSIVRTFDPNIFCGFDVSDELGQKVLDKAFMKVYEDFYNALEEDEQTIKNLIIEYILREKIQEKGLHILIKKLKNLDLEDLPDIT